MIELQKLGERLTRESPGVIARMQLSVEMLVALDEAKRIKSHNALRRHYRRLGKLLSNEALETVHQVIDEIDHKHNASVARFHGLERWRDRLMEGDSEGFGAYLEEYPRADRQHLRQLLQAARREREKGESVAAYRKLFKYLRVVAEL